MNEWDKLMGNVEREIFERRARAEIDRRRSWEEQYYGKIAAWTEFQKPRVPIDQMWAILEDVKDNVIKRGELSIHDKAGIFVEPGTREFTGMDGRSHGGDVRVPRADYGVKFSFNSLHTADNFHIMILGSAELGWGWVDVNGEWYTRSFFKASGSFARGEFGRSSSNRPGHYYDYRTREQIGDTSDEFSEDFAKKIIAENLVVLRDRNEFWS